MVKTFVRLIPSVVIPAILILYPILTNRLITNETDVINYFLY